MKATKPKADESVDALYQSLRSKHGDDNSKANGYLWHGYFLREQKILFGLLNPEANVILDVGCGSGLMCAPLVEKRALVAGVDFNQEACMDAKANGVAIVRGDAFELPVASESIDEIVCCQFFNQQSESAVMQFVSESARVLRPGGHVIMIWRNHEAYVHRVALALFRILERMRRLPKFPYENHTIESISRIGKQFGMTEQYTAVAFPPFSWVNQATGSWQASIIGASNISILTKR